MNQKLCCSINPYLKCTCKKTVCFDCFQVVSADKEGEWMCPYCARTWKDRHNPTMFTTVALTKGGKDSLLTKIFGSPK